MSRLFHAYASAEDSFAPNGMRAARWPDRAGPVALSRAGWAHNIVQIHTRHVSSITKIFGAYSYASGTMKQIRIVRKDSVYASCGPRFASEWMAASWMNRWFLKTRLAEALHTHGDGSHWIETQEKERAREMATA